MDSREYRELQAEYRKLSSSHKDLLEALEATEKALMDTVLHNENLRNWKTVDKLIIVRDKARSAIAKARGEEGKKIQADKK